MRVVLFPKSEPGSLFIEEDSLGTRLLGIGMHGHIEILKARIWLETSCYLVGNDAYQQFQRRMRNWEKQAILNRKAEIFHQLLILVMHLDFYGLSSICVGDS